MHIIITDPVLARSRALHLSGLQVAGCGLLLSLALVIVSAAIYHWVFLTGLREGWPVISTLVRVVTRDEAAQQERYLRENLDAMARRVGEMQARMVQLESLGERVSGLAGVPAPELKAPPGRGGALVEGRSLSIQELQATLSDLEALAGQRVDLLTVMESRLFDQKLRALMVPTQEPIPNQPTGSPFGWRIDPITGRSALHTGLDFQADTGTPILAAAGGVVVAQEYHPQYGNMVEIDHGNDVVSRYAHASKVLVRRGELVRRGQKVAEVGTTGRSTGAHLHFEVLVQGVFQDPSRFLAAGRAPPTVAQAAPGGPAPRR